MTGLHPGETVLWRPLRIEWNDVPAEIRTAVEPLIGAALFALPTWVAELNIFWSEENEIANGSACLSTTPREEYRYVSMWVHPNFLSYDEAGRYRVVVHEFSHAILRPVVAIAEALIEQVPEALREYVKDELRRSHEGATQDLTEALVRIKPQPHEGHAEPTDRTAGVV